MPEKPTSSERSIFQDLGLAVRLAWDMGYIIALPAVVFGFGGAYADRTWGTSPVFLLLGLGLALLLSSLGLKRKLKIFLVKQEKPTPAMEKS